ncbi:hypothetical protein, partial [Escherichia coli]|uniref:hypothetical protein n=1 Tax=Escherichia coli TaxID=562 RepID=UPI00197EED06
SYHLYKNVLSCRIRAVAADQDGRARSSLAAPSARSTPPRHDYFPHTQTVAMKSERLQLKYLGVGAEHT